MMFRSIFHTAVIGLLFAGLIATYPQAAMAQDSQQQKDIQKEDNNIHNEHVQKDKERHAQRKMNNDHHAITRAKDKAFRGIHKARLHHEERRGARLEHKIKSE